MGLPGGVDLREAGEVPEGLLIRVDLVVDLGNVTLVGAEDGRKGAEFDPAQQELLGAMILEQGVVYGGVTADIRVLEAIARETAGEQARDGALDAVVLVPVNHLVSNVHILRDYSLRWCAGPSAEDRDSAALAAPRLIVP